MGEYSSNSFKSKEEEQNKEVEKVAQKLVSSKKKGRNKFLSLFIAEDIGDIREYLFTDVIVPSIQKAIIDVVTEGITRLFKGSKASSSPLASKYSYRSYYDDKPKAKTLSEVKRDKGYDYETLVYETKGEAQIVLDAMTDILDRYQFVRVGDLFDLSDQTPAPTAYKYGWSDLRNASIERVMEGYIIKLPKAQPID